MYCWNCGKEILQDTRFCSSCGAGQPPFETAPTEAPSEPETPKTDAAPSGRDLNIRKKYILPAVSFLLSLIFAAGAFVSGYFALNTWNELNTPYKQDETSQLSETLDWIEGDSESEVADLNRKLDVTAGEIAGLETRQEQYLESRTQELLQSALLDGDTSDLMDRVLESDFFKTAFDQYLRDLLETFKTDQYLESWLYPYYTYSLEHGANKYICRDDNSDMWFYELPGGNAKFSQDMENDRLFLQNVYSYSLSEHLYYNGRIYITASDFMNIVLRMPDYVADCAVLVKAYGGNPDPAKMSVPGWSFADYRELWGNAVYYFYVEDPIWVYFGLSAQDFDLNWNLLADERAFYDAYLKLMDTIAPGLSVYDMVTYYASDDAYGGMGFDITGKEASLTDIALLYLKSHPEELEDLSFFDDSETSSFDAMIADTDSQLQELNAQTDSLTEERARINQLLEDRDSLRAQYDELLYEIQVRNKALMKSLCVFAGTALLTGSMALITFVSFIHFVKRFAACGN